MTSSRVPHNHAPGDVDAGSQGQLAPSTKNVGERIHPNSFVTVLPSAKFDVPTCNTCIAQCVGDRLHQLGCVFCFPESSMDQHDAWNAMVVLERRWFIGHVQVCILPRFGSPLHSIDGHDSQLMALHGDGHGGTRQFHERFVTLSRPSGGVLLQGPIQRGEVLQNGNRQCRMKIPLG